MLGEKIRELRESKNLDQKELAEKAGVTPAYISQIENGKKKNPSMDTLKNIAKALGIQPEVLFDGNTNLINDDSDIGKISINPKFKPIIDSLDRAGDLQDEDIDEIREQMEFLIRLKRKKKHNP